MFPVIRITRNPGALEQESFHDIGLSGNVHGEITAHVEGSSGSNETN
jgi:hypothetical protein